MQKVTPMSLISDDSKSSHAVAQLLEPGEQAIFLGNYREPFHNDESNLRYSKYIAYLPAGIVNRDGQDRARPSGPARFLLAVPWFVLFIVSWILDPKIVDWDRVRRRMSGSSGDGDPGSIAVQMWSATQRHSRFNGAVCAVTNRRLIIWLREFEKPPKLLFEIPRKSITTVTHRGGRLLQRSRVELHFDDGSMKACRVAVFSRSKAHQCISALTAPPDQPAVQRE